MRVLPSLLLLFLVFTGFAPEIAAQRKRTAPKEPSVTVSVVGLATPDVQKRLDAFEKVWQTISLYYFDGTFGGLDWERIRKEFEPRIRRTKTDTEAHLIIEEMIGRLKASHLAIVPPDVYEAIETAKAKAREKREERALLEAANDDEEAEGEADEDDEAYANYGIGVDLRYIGDRFVVSRVDPFSTARLAGIKPGFVIEAIDGVSLISLIGRVRLAYPKNERVLNYLPFEIVAEVLNSPEPLPVTVSYRDAENALHSVEIAREKLPSLAVNLGNNIPERQLLFERRALTEDIGYIRFDNFSLPVIEKFCEAIEIFETKKALVIDLRGNIGGVLSVSSTLAGMLSDKPFKLGTSVYRYGTENMESAPKARNYKGTVIVLIDRLSISAAEMFAAALQDSKRAMIIGERSAGETLPSVSVALPTGATFLYPIANFKTPSGRFLEGAGVVPDKVIALDRSTLLSGSDPQLNAAIKTAETLISATQNPPPPAGTGVPIATLTGGSPGPPPPPPAKKDSAVPPALFGSASKPPVIEGKARQYMDQFAAKAGGIEAFDKLESYEMLGEVTITQLGSANRFDYKILKSGKDKYTEVLTSPSTGEIRDIRNGKTIHIKGDLGIDQIVPFPVEIEKSDIISMLRSGFRVDDFKTLKYLGEYELEGRKVHLIDGQTTSGASIALTYHSETLLLAGYEGPNGGMKFDDYRRVGEVMLPFRIYNRAGLDIKFDEIKLNTKIDPSVFEHRERCYDRVGNN